MIHVHVWYTLAKFQKWNFISNCSILQDKVWEKDSYEFIIPSTDFCGAFPECDANLPPVVRFYDNTQENPIGIIDMKESQTNETNKIIENIWKPNGAEQFSATYLVFIVHGFINHGEMEWILNLKESVINRYNTLDTRVVVGVVDWNKG